MPDPAISSTTFLAQTVMNTNDTPSPYLIVTSELGCICDLIATQYRHQFSSTLSYSEFLDTLNYLDGVVSGFANSSYQTWAKEFFTGLSKFDEISKLQVLSQYGQFAGRGMKEVYDIHWPATDPWISMWHAFVNGWHWRDAGGDQDQWVGPALNPPRYPAYKEKYDKVLEVWRATPSPDYIAVCPEMYKSGAGYDLYKKVLEKSEKDSPDMFKLPDTLTKKQLATAQTLMSKGTLNDKEYLFFFFLLCALPTGDADAKKIADSLSRQVESTDDCPHESFINHLIYLVLLHLANPTDIHKQVHTQLCEFIRKMRNAILVRGNDGGVPALILTALNKNLDKLNLDKGYPHVSLPGLGLTHRMTMERIALDSMRAASKSL